MKIKIKTWRFCGALFATTILPHVSTAAPPAATNPAIELTLLAEHPHVLTPTGVDVARDGRLFVLENNTHFRPEVYADPSRKSDRILVFEDPGDGSTAPAPKVFYEGLVWGTDLAISSSGWIYASTRMEIFRMRDTNGDGVADDVRGVIDMETEGDHPHNGISGLCFDANGNLSFGLGENYGAPYTLSSPDGKRLTGGGEGGSTYRCAHDGSGLTRMSTGIWNPFGMEYDDAGNLFATDNDPSSSPPCRLLHVVKGTDFGYEYRYGRTGRHPLVTWTGEFPGTTGMVSGTGEAPCGVIPFGPGVLLVASWADHRIDSYHLYPDGASFRANRHPFLTGDNEFRPVDIAMAADRQTFYITDWVSSSYPVHGQGRIWRMRLPEALPDDRLDPHPELRRAESIREMTETGHLPGLIQILDDPDRHIRNAAIHALSQMGTALDDHLTENLLETSLQRAGVLIALKRTRAASATERIPDFIADPDADVRLAAIKWIADAKLKRFRPLLERQLTSPDLDNRLFLAAMAALDALDGNKPTDIPKPGRLLTVVRDPEAAPRLRATSLRLIPPSEKNLTLELLESLLVDKDPTIRLEALRSLAAHPDPGRGPLLAAIAGNPEEPEANRAEAIAGLALIAKDFPSLVNKLASSSSPALRDEAQRALIGIVDPAIAAVSGSAPTAARISGPKPLPTNIPAWETLLGDKPGDPAAGRRIFFHPKVGTCSRCHRMEGRGIRVGPDLTSIWQHPVGDNDDEDDTGALRRWLLEAILQPNTTIAPQFLPWEVTLTDGTTRVGLPLRKGGNREAYLGPDGREFSILKPEIASHRELPVSLMPPALLEQLTVNEARDLLAYLMAEK